MSEKSWFYCGDIESGVKDICTIQCKGCNDRALLLCKKPNHPPCHDSQTP